MSALLPCPFCGGAIGEDDDAMGEVGGRKFVSVACPQCNTTGPEVFIDEGDYRQAVDGAREAWNRRASPWKPIPHDWLRPPKSDEWDDLNERGRENERRPLVVGLAIDRRSQWWRLMHDIECVTCGHTAAHHDCEDANCETAFCGCHAFVAPLPPAPGAGG